MIPFPFVRMSLVALCFLLFLTSNVFAQNNAISEDRADGVPNAEVVKPRISILRFLRQDTRNLARYNVTTMLLSVTDGNGNVSTGTELGSPSTRVTFFTPSDDAWVQLLNRLYENQNVPDTSSPSAIARGLAERFNFIRDNFQDVPSLYRTLRYHLVPGEAYYPTNAQDGNLSTLAGITLFTAENENIVDMMNESTSAAGAKYLLTNGWVIPIEKVMLPFNITTVLERVKSLPTVSVKPTKTPVVTPSVSGSEPPSPPPSVEPGASPSTSPSASSTPMDTSETTDPTSSDDMGVSDPSLEPSGSGEVGEGGDGSGGESGSSDVSSAPTDDGSDDGVCFPASARVHVDGGALVAMEHLDAGVHVVHSESGQSSKVFLFTHRTSKVTSTFRKISTACGHSVKLTANHYMYANGQVVAAGAVSIGDVLRTVDGPCAVTDVRTVQDVGLYAPHTMHGDLVVDGIVVSGYSRAVHPDLAHALLAPVRWFASVSGFKEPLGKLFYNGANWALHVMPRGKDRY